MMTISQMKLEIQALGNEKACLIRELPKLRERIEYMEARIKGIPSDILLMQTLIEKAEREKVEDQRKAREAGKRERIEKQIKKLQKELERA